MGASRDKDGLDKPKPVVSPPNTVTIQQLVTGCKVYVDRPEEATARKAEILSIRHRQPPRVKRGESGPSTPAEVLPEFYIHYVEFNKRLDEWVPAARLLMSRQVEWPAKPGAAPSAHSTPNARSKLPVSKGSSGTTTPDKAPHKAAGDGMLRRAAIRAAASRRTRTPNKRRRVEDASEDGDPDDMSIDGEGEVDESAIIPDDQDADGEGELESVTDDPDQPATFSKEQEIESLRTHGSMTQSHHEVHRVKNLDRIQMGKHEVEAWYFSPYPSEYAHIPVLYICEFCLSFFGTPKMLERHRAKCTMLHPPGNEIYRHEDLSFFEIDGRKQRTWCRNLCLLSKAFLDHKTLYYDVDPFLFYVMCTRDDTGVHFVGYFSKEKESAEGYNVACILTLPQYQRNGWGRTLIEFSYELSIKENKLGSPEKPLSDLGLLSYRAYWTDAIIECLMEAQVDISIEDIAQRTSITQLDITNTCHALHMIKSNKGQYMFCLSDALIESHEKSKKKRKRRIHPEKLLWKPPVFSREQLRFGF